MDWTERGRSLIADRAFKYISPEVYASWTDPATGRRFNNVIIGGALTNHPKFKSLTLEEHTMPTLTYPEVQDLVKRAMTDPEAYAEYLRWQHEIAEYEAVQAHETVQAAEPDYVPGRGLERMADDQIGKLARERMAAKGIAYPQAYAEVLQENPDLYSGYAQAYDLRAAAMAKGIPDAQESRQFSYSPYRDGANGTRVTTPAGVAAAKRGRDLEDEINNALNDIARQYPLSPRVFQLAKLFDTNKSLRRRAVAACHSS